MTKGKRHKLGKIIVACIIGIIGAILVTTGKIIQHLKRRKRRHSSE